MKLVETVTVPLRSVRRHDKVIAVNGDPLSEPSNVIAPFESTSGAVQLVPTPAGSERRLYDGEHPEVTVERTHIVPNGGELVFDADDFGVTADALMIMAERLEADGNPSGQVRNALRTLVYFADPAAEAEVVVRPKQGETAALPVADFNIHDLNVFTVRTYNALMRLLGHTGVHTFGDLAAMTAEAVQELLPEPRAGDVHGRDADLRKTFLDLRAVACHAVANGVTP